MNQESHKLLQLLNQESELAANLLELMLLEKDALENNQHDNLNAITRNKAICLDQIEQISYSRSQLLLTLSLAATTNEKMREFISKQPDSDKTLLQEALTSLEQQLAKCKNQNSVNGMVISMSQRNIQRNLNILKGVDQNSLTYTPKGETTSLGKQYDGLKV